MRREREHLRASDPSFVGGVVGLPGRERVRLSAAWDAPTARVALFLSWSRLGMLSRAVHCNGGRPQLWALRRATDRAPPARALG